MTSDTSSSSSSVQVKGNANMDVVKNTILAMNITEWHGVNVCGDGIVKTKVCTK